MAERFLPAIPLAKLKHAQAVQDMNEYYDLLCQPLHEELYKRQDFSFFDELNDGQQMLICYDYIQNHVLQGGFIQLIQNGYTNMLLPMHKWLTDIGDKDMAMLLDSVMKVYVEHKDILERDLSPQEFAGLYEKLPVFGPLDKRFEALHPHTIELMLTHATNHISDFVILID